MVYSYKILNRDGEILRQAPRRLISVYYKHYWVWGAIKNRNADYFRAMSMMGPSALADLLGNFE